MERPLRFLRKPPRPLRAKNQPRHLLGLLICLLFSFQSIAQSGPVSIVEVTAPGSLTPDKLLALTKKHGLPSSAVYRWQNHLVAYGPTATIQQLRQPLKKAYPGATVRLYAAPLYRFDRQRCADKAPARQWNNLILTANLVADPAKQQEYVQHHATQFAQWPEVAQGFCNASFQQLLVFRQGRQLMLVISIPRGASLDELNPKTTENNPRVDEWNALMKQYQEGLPGTKPGEVWVFMQPAATVQLRPPSRQRVPSN